MQNTLTDAEHISAALHTAGVQSTIEDTGGHVMVTYVTLPRDGGRFSLGITNENHGDDGWLICLYDRDEEECEGDVVARDVNSTERAVALIKSLVTDYSA
jgi:hypothetical protein